MLCSVMLTGCEPDKVIYDSVNGESIATFQSPTPDPLIFNPVADTRNVYTVSVSKVSTVDRTVSVSVDSSSTLDPSFYNIEDLNPVIPAGEFSTDIVITTPASEVFPPTGSTLKLKLNSVEGAQIKSFSIDTYAVPFSVNCPSVDVVSIPGTYQITTDEFGGSLGDDMVDVVAGPGDNQFTLVNPFDHPTPDAGGAGNYEVIVDVNPETGALSVNKQAALNYDNFDPSPGYGAISVEGSGKALTCIGKLSFSLKYTVAAGSFGTLALVLQKVN